MTRIRSDGMGFGEVLGGRVEGEREGLCGEGG